MCDLLSKPFSTRYTYNNQPDKAIEYNLRLRHPDAFDLIQEYNMFDAVKDKAMLLMEFDQHLLSKEENKSTKPTQMPAVQLLVKNTDAIPVKCTFIEKCRLFKVKITNTISI